eukprot:CAMPEP_0117528750 /NCGR_PEP_ID=MMETSP0784-20121206/37474_1 /TAXON_ID=39447 /ORGANISM="" /LENGTH=222 /DNA_ID=CAMNT_0005325043 /DNA_START=1 /DNA_END=669 /DNA_ORIENTATION=+
MMGRINAILVIFMIMLQAALISATGVLFARIGSECAEAVSYGPEVITATGSSSGIPFYLSTHANANVASDTWTQIVTSDGTTELFRIVWQFNDVKTVTDRIVNAVAVGEPVSYTVTEAGTGTTHSLASTWRFSSTSQVTAPQLATATTACCLSSDDGAWGADNTVVDGELPPFFDGQVSQFWGQANWNVLDHSSTFGCGNVWLNGARTPNTNAVSYMYVGTI